jgi:ATP-binding cassette subfamily B (MDR/TAP) protein 1
MLENILKQDKEFFDKANFSTGALVSKTGTTATALQELLGFNITIILIGAINLLSSCILAIVIGWKLGLVIVFGAMPVVVFCGYLRIRLEFKLDEDVDQRFSDSSSLAAEAVASIRSVASFTLEHYFSGRYRDQLRHIERQSMKTLVWTMFWFSLTQSVNFLAMALGFWYGGRLLSTGEYSSSQFFIVFISVIFSSEAAAQFFGYSTSKLTNNLI